jgi:hypothetical protein
MYTLSFGCGTQTTGAGFYLNEFTILQDGCFLNVGLPATLGVTLRKAYVVTGHRLLATDFALCHDLTFPLLKLIWSTKLLRLGSRCHLNAS